MQCGLKSGDQGEIEETGADQGRRVMCFWKNSPGHVACINSCNSLPLKHSEVRMIIIPIFQRRKLKNREVQ